MFKVKMHDIFPNSMSMARTKESLIVDAVDTLRENKTALLDKSSGTCPVPPQGVPTWLRLVPHLQPHVTSQTQTK